MTVVINNQGRFDIGEVLEFVDIDASIASDDLDELLKSSAIRIVFGSCADGRFLTLGRQLRLRGYSGHIRAAGPLVPDQFPMALKLGIDSTESPLSTRRGVLRINGLLMQRARRGIISVASRVKTRKP